jgi:hypothetical protein
VCKHPASPDRGPVCILFMRGEATPAWVPLPLVDHASMRTVAAYDVSFVRLSFAMILRQSNILLHSRNSSATVCVHRQGACLRTILNGYQLSAVCPVLEIIASGGTALQPLTMHGGFAALNMTMRWAENALRVAYISHVFSSRFCIFSFDTLDFSVSAL